MQHLDNTWNDLQQTVSKYIYCFQVLILMCVICKIVLVGESLPPPTYTPNIKLVFLLIPVFD